MSIPIPALAQSSPPPPPHTQSTGSARIAVAASEPTNSGRLSSRGRAWRWPVVNLIRLYGIEIKGGLLCKCLHLVAYTTHHINSRALVFLSFGSTNGVNFHKS
jgi:hypothetical protein